MPTFDANVLPNNTGKDLGSPSQRWDGFFQNLDVSGTTNITVPNPVLPNPIERNLTGDVTGNVTGNVTGDVTGNVTGNLTGAVTGNVTGNLTGNVTGNVTGDVTSTGTSTIKNLNTVRNSGYFADVKAAVDDIGANAGRVNVTTGAHNFATGVAVAAPGLKLAGDGIGSKVTYTGTGTAFQCNLGQRANLALSDLWLACNNAASGPGIELTNTTTSSSQFSLTNVKVSDAPTAQGGIRLKSESASGNIYGVTLDRVDSSFNGIGVDVTGGYEVDLLTIQNSLLEGNVNAVRFTKTSSVAPSMLHRANLLANNMQGCSDIPILVDASYLHGIIAGNYFEQASGTPLLQSQNAGQFRCVAAIGNNFVTTAAADYIWKNQYNGTGAAAYLVSMSNQLGPCATAAYKIDGIAHGFMGFGDFVPVACPAHFDWTGSPYKDLIAWDGVNHTFTISSDGTNFDHPKFGIGMKGDAVTAALHVGAPKTPATVSGTNGTGGIFGGIFNGGAGGNTSTANTAGNGRGFRFTTGIGGNAAAGGINGNGGTFQIILSNAGSGAGSAGTPGFIDISNNSGTNVAKIEQSGKATFNGGLVLNNVAAPTAAANQISLGSTTATTVGAAGAASALPATPTGYWIINVAGTAMKVPYYTS